MYLFICLFFFCPWETLYSLFCFVLRSTWNIQFLTSIKFPGVYYLQAYLPSNILYEKTAFQKVDLNV